MTILLLPAPGRRKHTYPLLAAFLLFIICSCRAAAALPDSTYLPTGWYEADVSHGISRHLEKGFLRYSLSPAALIPGRHFKTCKAYERVSGNTTYRGLNLLLDEAGITTMNQLQQRGERKIALVIADRLLLVATLVPGSTPANGEMGIGLDMFTSEELQQLCRLAEAGR